MHKATVLADSVTPDGIRLITVEVTFPRYLLSEFNTHRLFSRNSASSRAIPPEIQLARILDAAFTPANFYTRAKGMGQDEPLEGSSAIDAEEVWLIARDDAVKGALELITSPTVVAQNSLRGVLEMVGEAVRDGDVPTDWLNVSKSTVNRILEPYMWHTVIVSSTEWENFFALRSPLGNEVDTSFGAEPEIQRTAIAMREAMRASSPTLLSEGEWHLPLVTGEDRLQIDAERPSEPFALPYLCAGRCARVSFDKHGETEPIEKSLSRAEGLLSAGHMSPFEHAARPFSDDETAAVGKLKDLLEAGISAGAISGHAALRMADQLEFCGNFRGWVQLRKMIPDEENRVGALAGRPSWATA
jgi:hypothetical protein